MICISGMGILCQIPADTEYSIYVAGSHSVSEKDTATGKMELVEYGDLVIETPAMRRTFRSMKYPTSCLNEMEVIINDQKEGYLDEAFVDLFDLDWEFESFECQPFR